jgi:hypothetical protein
MSVGTDKILGVIWKALKTALGSSATVVRGSRRPKDTSNPSVTVDWASGSELRKDSGYNLDEVTLQVTIFGEEQDGCPSETFEAICQTIDATLNGKSFRLSEGGEEVEGEEEPTPIVNYGTWRCDRDDDAILSGFDAQTKEYFKTFRYSTMIAEI